ncbi:hypothetical protein ACVFI8_13000 [Agarivorans sp. MS3-6]
MPSNDYESANEAEISSSKLLAYRSARGAAITAISLLIPFGTVAFFIFYCINNEGYALSASVEIGNIQFIALIVHGLYFLMLPFGFELMIDKLPFPGSPEKYRFGKIPKRPDNLYWMMTHLSGELFFLGAVMLLLMASQPSVPRWVLILPIAQCAYNMKNDLLWVGFGKYLSPIRKPMSVMALDWFVIGICLVIYIVHFFTA